MKKNLLIILYLIVFLTGLYSKKIYAQESPIYTPSSCDSISTLPWIESFDTYGTGTTVFPLCWHRNTTNLNRPYVNYIAFQGAGSLYFSTISIGNYNIATTPMFSSLFPVNTLMASFKYKTTNLTDTLYVGVMSDPQNVGTFQTIAVLNNPDSQSWYDKVVFFNQYFGTGSYIAFKIQQTGPAVKAYIDNLNIDIAPLCLFPLDLNTSNIDVSSLDLNWTEVGNATSWNIKYAPVGFPDSSETIIQGVTSNPFHITGLIPQTAYQFSVQSNCGTGVSPWSLPKVSVTTCDVISQLPYIETFDYYGYGSLAYPLCWTKLNNGTNYPNISTTNFSPPSSLSFGCSTPGAYNYAVSPKIADSILLNTLRIEFKLHNLQLDDTLYLGILSNFADTSTFTLIDKISVPIISEFFEYGVNLNSYTGAGKYIALKAIYGPTNTYFSVDDFKILPIPLCPKPIGLEVVSLTDSTALLNWTNDTNVSSWKIEYGPLGFTPGMGIQINNVTNTPLLISGLTPQTSYQFYVTAMCDSVHYSILSSPFTFTTACNPITTLPYYENFDSYGSGYGVFPSCWSYISPYDLSVSLYLYSPYFSSPNSLHLFSTSVLTYKYVMSPFFDNSILLNSLKLNFKMRVTDLDDTLYVGIMNSSPDPNTFELIQKVTSNNVDVWNDYEIFLNSYSGNGNRIAFKTTFSSNSTGVFLDDVRIDTMPPCPRPSILVANSIQTNSFLLGFVENGTANNWTIEYGPIGFVPDSGNGIVLSNVNTNPFLVSGLITNTTYQFYVKSNCGVGEESLWSNPLTVTTSCYQITSLPWTDSFDTYGTGNTVFPFCWTKNSNVSNNPYIGVSTYSSPGSLTFSCSANGNFNIAATPMFNPNIPINTLKANFKMKALGIDDTLYVGVMTNPNIESTFETIAKLNISSSNYWFDFEVPFNDYSGTGNYIAFKTKYGTTSSVVYLDNLTISVIPTCPSPTNLVTSGILNSLADISWTENGTANNWKIEYGLSGFIQGTGTMVFSNTNFLTLCSLSDTTCYDFYVQSVCSPIDSSFWSNKGTFCTAQMPAIVPITFDFEIPSGFQFANNPSGNKWYIGTDFENSVNNTLGGSKGLFISNQFGYLNTYNLTSPCVVWAYRDIYFTPCTDDYLLSFDWKLNGEVNPNDFLSVYIGESNMPIPSTTANIIPPFGSDTLVTLLRQQTTFQSDTIYLPLSEYSGLTKRIFFMWQNNNANGAQPPAAVDNISITTIGETLCLSPSNVTISSINFHSALVSWVPGYFETEWIVEYKKNSEAIWIPILVTSIPSIVLDSLSQLTDYDVRVKTQCNTFTFSIYTSIEHFSTSANPCITPTNLNFDVIFDQYESLYWTPGDNQSSWQLELKLESSSTWDTAIIITTPYIALQGIVQTNSHYYARVKALCGTGESDYSNTLFFQTGNGVIYHTITATASGPGTISPLGSVETPEFTSVQFDFHPSQNGVVSAIEVDSIIYYGNYSNYIFGNIHSDHTLHVYFGTIEVEENEKDYFITLFPNPSQTSIELNCDQIKLQVNDCKIYDIFGKLIRVIPIKDETTSIDVSDYASGVYIIHIESERGTIFKKFVKK